MKYILAALFCFLFLFSFSQVKVKKEYFKESDENEYLKTVSSFDRNGRIISKIFKSSEGRMTEQIKYGYNENGYPVSEIKEVYREDGHMYELIEERTFDDEGKLLTALFGNNYNGKWQSQKYMYNEYDDVDYIYFHQKSGKLKFVNHFKIKYDSKGRKINKIRYNGKTAESADKKELETEYEYDNSGNLIYEKNTGLFDSEIIQKFNSNNKIISRIENTDFGKISKKYFYNISGKIKSIQYFYNDEKESESTFQYDENGKEIKKSSILDNGNKIINRYEYIYF